MNWITIATINEIPSNTKQTFLLDNGTSVIVANINGQFYAIEDRCTHDDGDMADGELEADAIICPRHGAKFCLKTGAVLAPPAYEPVKCYELKIVEGLIQLKA